MSITKDYIMAVYVKAELGLNHSIIYTDSAGRYFRFSGGSWAWRNHNPGNLVPGKISARHNQIGSSGKFAIFPDYENGHLALLDCLETTYKNATIDDLVEAYAPAKDGNLDVVVCITAMGHSYIRGRPNSSINPCLRKLVVKKPRKDK